MRTKPLVISLLFIFGMVSLKGDVLLMDAKDQLALKEMETFIDASDEDLPEQTVYGLGLRRLLIGGQELIGHTGSIPGYSGIVMNQPTNGYTIAILSNLSTIEQAQLLGQIQRIINP